MEEQRGHGRSRRRERPVVLTFDDGVKSHLTFVAPLLKKMSFRATFYVSDGPRFQGGENYLTWEDARKLADLGFEIGNHLGRHTDVTRLAKDELTELIRQVEVTCTENGIPKPVTFGYPGYEYNLPAVEVLQELGYKFARRGVAPEHYRSDYGDRGPFYRPDEDHPLLVPTTMASGPGWYFEDLVETLDRASDGEIIVLTYHGVPDLEHNWVHTSEEDFSRQMALLRDRGCRVLALKDVVGHTPERFSHPGNPLAAVKKRSMPQPIDLLCEYLENPLRIDLPHPRFSWSFDPTRRDLRMWRNVGLRPGGLLALPERGVRGQNAGELC